MSVQVNFYGPLEKWAGKRSFFGKGSCVKEVLNSIDEQIGKSVLKHLLDDKGRMKAQFHVLLNGVDIESLDGLASTVEDGDIITCVPPIGGG
ncbi:MAG: MoaD/ThiS family protein [Candidatus Hodarchaeales archaeon]